MAWIALVDTGSESGCMHFTAGSHRRPEQVLLHAAAIHKVQSATVPRWTHPLRFHPASTSVPVWGARVGCSHCMWPRHRCLRRKTIRRPAAAIHMENLGCSCKLNHRWPATRVTGRHATQSAVKRSWSWPSRPPTLRMLSRHPPRYRSLLVALCFGSPGRFILRNKTHRVLSPSPYKCIAGGLASTA